MAERRDIADRADCERLVRAFYARAMDDTMIGYLFTDVAKLDLEAHVPVITDFWETILLGGEAYRGGAFGPHLRLNAKSPLRGGHFERWLTIWTQTVDALFEGPTAELAKSHAQRVARAFHRRIQGLPDETDVTPAPLRITRHGT
jgi:hemoglobin